MSPEAAKFVVAAINPGKQGSFRPCDTGTARSNRAGYQCARSSFTSDESDRPLLSAGIPRIRGVDAGVDEVAHVAGRECSAPVAADCCNLRVRQVDRASGTFSRGNDFRLVRHHTRRPS
jgi:hypothetical protein